MVGFSTRTKLQRTMHYRFDSFWQKKKKQVPGLHHAPYSPDLAPCVLFLFPKLKHLLKGTHFQSIEDIQKKTTDLLKEFTQNDFQKCFHAWKEHMQHCIEAQGNYFEGDNLQHT
jgi:histone-lysine N-methyltransferase SETMAR